MLAGPQIQLTQPAVIYDSITQTIGRTPLIKMHRLARLLNWQTVPMAELFAVFVVLTLASPGAALGCSLTRV